MACAIGTFSELGIETFLVTDWVGGISADDCLTCAMQLIIGEHCRVDGASVLVGETPEHLAGANT